jgi:hypothetical protein
MGTLAKKISKEEDRGHRQARVRLSKATWANIIATRYRGFSLGAIALCSVFFWWYSASLKFGV